jgi:ribosome biogenesis GTPase / thiamine phosphate phosphatase
MNQPTVAGRVIRAQSGFYSVETEQGIVISRLRGRLKHKRFLADIVAVGDRVSIAVQQDGSGAIEEVLPREHALIRTSPTARGEYQQILLANLDQLVLVFACAQPRPRLRMLDRFLVITEKQEIPATIVANKVDVIGIEEAQKIFSPYTALGYPVVYTSAKSGLGIEELREKLVNKLSALAGPSGVGKTSLLNTLQPGLGLIVREVSQSTEKGKHTTQVRQLYPLEEGGYLADLPGLRTLALWDTEPEELDGYFREISPLVSHCQFSDCTHQMEPGCAVRLAVEAGQIHPERYESYLKLRFGEDEA